MLREVLDRLAAGQDLPPDLIDAFIAAVGRDELGDAQIAAFLMGLRLKGVSGAETTAIASAMRARCVPVRPRVTAELLDTCGTGGGLATFNISTATAFVCAAAGIPVAKHGSRSLSGRSGSADVLESLGVAIALPVAAVERLIEEVGIAFLHAPGFHPIMRRLLPVEAALGIKTVFYSLIGPLISPARAPRHLLGVYRPDWLALTAGVVADLGLTRALVVHGSDGVDEISLLGPTRIQDVDHGRVSVYEVAPEDLGLSRCRLDDIRARSPQDNAALIRAVFSGSVTGAPRDAILINSAGALVAGGQAAGLREGLALATELLDSGAVARKLDALVAASQALASPAPDVAPPLRHAERVWQGLLESTPDGMLLLRPDGQVEHANEQALAQLGASVPAVVGQAYGATLPPALQQARRERLAGVVAQRRVARWEDSDGDRHFLLTAIPIHGAESVVLFCRDLSEQKRAEASEQDKRARLKTLIETLPDLIWLKDTEGRYLNCNHRFERFAGLGEAELKGRRDAEVFPPELADSLSRSARQCLAEQRSVATQEWVGYADDGHREFVEIVQTPFIDPHGRAMGIMGIARDVTAFKHNEDELRSHRARLELLVSERTAELSRMLTELKHTQHELIEAEKLASLGALVAGISHELNTPIGNLVTVTSALQDRHAELTQVMTQGRITRTWLADHLAGGRDMLALAQRSAQRAATLIENFRQVAVDQTALHRRHFELRELVAAAIATLRPAFADRQIAFANEVPPGVALDSFPGPLGEVLTHLLNNCATHAFEGRAAGEVHVAGRAQAGQIVLQVSDNGIGMDAATLAHVFDPFFTTKLGRGGSGLGLPISRRIASGVLGGDLVARSTPGQGSTFTLTLPRHAPGRNLAS